MDVEIEELARGRDKDLPSTRRLSEDFEQIGVMGELEFGKKIGKDIDRNKYAGGDKGIDFQLPFTIDVKTAKKPWALLVEQGKAVASIYVLAGAQKMEDGNYDIYFVGWMWGYFVKMFDLRDLGTGVINHYAPADKLEPMENLYALIDYIKND